MKYFIKDTRTEVKLGEVFSIRTIDETSYGITETVTSFTITEENLPILIKEGIVVASETAPIPTDILYYLEKVAKKLKWKTEKIAHILDDLSDVNNAVVFSLLLKEVAITIDKKYPDHISNSKDFYVISLEDGMIHQAERAPKNFKWISVFRTAGDASLAISILKDIHESMFPNLYNEQKD